MTISAEIKARRQMRGITQAELADQAGIAQALVSRIESGHTLTVATLERLSSVLGPFEVPTVHVWHRADEIHPTSTRVVWVRTEEGTEERAVYARDERGFYTSSGPVKVVEWREQ